MRAIFPAVSKSTNLYIGQLLLANADPRDSRGSSHRSKIRILSTLILLAVAIGYERLQRVWATSLARYFDAMTGFSVSLNETQAIVRSCIDRTAPANLIATLTLVLIGVGW
jgi:hypothetical protein